MKSLLKAVALAAVLAVPAVSFAQSQPENGPVTRAQVRNELKQLESVGWRPNVVSPYYPEDYRAAQAASPHVAATVLRPMAPRKAVRPARIRRRSS